MTRPGTTLEAGDIVLVPFPFTDLSAAKRRPALVLTGSAYHETSGDFVAAYVTSEPQREPWAVRITNADLESGGLVAPSWVRADKIATLEKALVRKVVARVGAPKRVEVRDVIHDLVLPGDG